MRARNAPVVIALVAAAILAAVLLLPGLLSGSKDAPPSVGANGPASSEPSSAADANELARSTPTAPSADARATVPERERRGWPARVEVVDENAAPVEDAELWLLDPGDDAFRRVGRERPLADLTVEPGTIAAFVHEGHCTRFAPAIAFLGDPTDGTASHDAARDDAAPGEAERIRTTLPRAGLVHVDVDRKDDGEPRSIGAVRLDLAPAGIDEAAARLAHELSARLARSRDGAESDAAPSDPWFDPFGGDPSTVSALEFAARDGAPFDLVASFAAAAAAGAFDLTAAFEPTEHCARSAVVASNVDADELPLAIAVAPTGVALVGTVTDVDRAGTPPFMIPNPLVVRAADGALYVDGRLPRLAPTADAPSTLVLTNRGHSAVRFDLPEGADTATRRANLRFVPRGAGPDAASWHLAVPHRAGARTFPPSRDGSEPDGFAVNGLGPGTCELQVAWKEAETGRGFSHHSRFELGVEEVLDLGVLAANDERGLLTVRFEPRFGPNVTEEERALALERVRANVVLSKALWSRSSGPEFYAIESAPLGGTMEVPGVAGIPLVMYVDSFFATGRSSQRAWASDLTMAPTRINFDFTVDGDTEIVVPVVVERAHPVALSIAVPGGVEVVPAAGAVRRSDDAQLDRLRLAEELEVRDTHAIVDSELHLPDGTWRVLVGGRMESNDDDPSMGDRDFFGFADVVVEGSSETSVMIELVEYASASVRFVSGDEALAEEVSEAALRHRFARPDDWTCEPFAHVVAGSLIDLDESELLVGRLLPNTEYELLADGRRFVTGAPGSTITIEL